MSTIRRRVLPSAAVVLSAGVILPSLTATIDARAAESSPPPGVVEFTHVDGRDANGSYSRLAVAVDGRLVSGAQAVARLAGENRYETAVAISQKRYATTKAVTVYLARGDRMDDALAGGALTDGPVLLVPSDGDVPDSVRAEIRRLAPAQVIALGGHRAVSDAVLAVAAQGRATGRLAGASSYETAAAIAARAFRGGASEVFLARGGDSPDAVAGGILTTGPVLPVPRTGEVPEAIRAAIVALRPSRVIALGGEQAVPGTTLRGAAAGRAAERRAGTDRYRTSAAIARHAFPRGARVAYLAGGTAFVDAVSGGSLVDGPILLTPPPGNPELATELGKTLAHLGVTTIVGLGGVDALPEAAIAAVLAETPTVPRPAPTTSTPTPTSTSPSGSPTVEPLPPSTVTPAPTATTTTPAACDAIVGTFRPIPLHEKYTINCVNSLSDPRALGLTTTRLYENGTLFDGVIQIVRGKATETTQQVIAHELAHAYSYSYLTPVQRAWFVTELRTTDPLPTSNDFNDPASYEHMPAEQWARGQASCKGYADPYRRPTASCTLIDRTIAYRP